jgi:hypothetical protein
MIVMTRPTPFSLVFGELAAERFPALQQGLTAAGRDPRDRNAFLLVREVNALMQELRPEEGFGEGVGVMAALLHASYLFWLDGERVVAIDDPLLTRLLSAPPTRRDSRLPSPGGAYVQLPSLRVWGTPVESAAPEPLDGWFVVRGEEELAVVAVFGLHPGRGGLTVAEVAGPALAGLARADGSALFSPTLAGGNAAGLASIQGEEELLELAWRVEEGT